MGGGYELLFPGPDPLHRPPSRVKREHRADVVGMGIVLGAEAAPQDAADHMDGGLRLSEDGCDGPLVEEHRLGHRVDVCAAHRGGVGNAALGFDGGVLLSGSSEIALHDVIRRREALLALSLAYL